MRVLFKSAQLAIQFVDFTSVICKRQGASLVHCIVNVEDAVSCPVCAFRESVDVLEVCPIRVLPSQSIECVAGHERELTMSFLGCPLFSKFAMIFAMSASISSVA